jgi:energy-coupling factor transport system ATP-binding protein
MRVEIRGLSFSYPGGVEALREISLAIETGETVAVVGQNGAGKTTLLRHFNGLLRPSRGSVQVGDWDTARHSVAQLAARVGYVFQNPDEQLFCRTVRAEVAFGPTNLKFPAGRAAGLTAQALALTDLTGKEEANPYDLSPAWRKLVALASILAMDTPIVLLDEPTTGQDAVNAGRIAHIVQTLKAQGRTVVAISHDIDFCAENFDRIIAMGQGRVLLDGAPRQVLAEEELLASTYVDPPQLTRLGRRLGFPELVCNADEFLQALRTARPDAPRSA